MGSSTSNTIRSNQTVSNRVLQVSSTRCDARCENKINGLTIVIIGGNGNINIMQECKLSNIQCIMRNNLNTNIENILEAMAKQSASAMNGFTLDWTNVSNTVDLYQYIENTITQTMDASCTFYAGNEATGLYFYVEGGNHDINLSQSATITNATCNMDNMAKAVTYNEETSKADQKSSIFNIFSLLFVVIIICAVLAAVVAVVFLLTGGVAAVASSAAGGKDGKGGGGLPVSLSQIEGIIAKNPELLAL